MRPTLAQNPPPDGVLFQNSTDARIEDLQDVRMTSALRSRSARDILELADARVPRWGRVGAPHQTTLHVRLHVRVR